MEIPEVHEARKRTASIPLTGGGSIPARRGFGFSMLPRPDNARLPRPCRTESL